MFELLCEISEVNCSKYLMRASLMYNKNIQINYLLLIVSFEVIKHEPN